jgi:hypothetical protein
MTEDRFSPASVVKVGNGRGFIIEHRLKLPRSGRPSKHTELAPYIDYRLVVTAAHCLPHLPPAHPAANRYERTYKQLLGSFDGRKSGVWTECLFADPVADIAALGCPDYQEHYDEATAYDALTDDVSFLRIGTAKSGPGWVLSLDGRWIPSRLEILARFGGIGLWIDPTEEGQSGSPILNHSGQAVGVVAVGAESATGETKNLRCGPQPILARNLPGWLLSGH